MERRGWSGLKGRGPGEGTKRADRARRLGQSGVVIWTQGGTEGTVQVETEVCWEKESIQSVLESWVEVKPTGMEE